MKRASAVEESLLGGNLWSQPRNQNGTVLRPIPRGTKVPLTPTSLAATVAGTTE
jgi:hypothetical protein